MVSFLSKAQVLHLHQRLIDRFGGPVGLRDEGAPDSTLARPQSTFDGEDLYPSLAEKAATLLHSLVSNHPFLDGNKRVAALSAELFLLVNGLELTAVPCAERAYTLSRHTRLSATGGEGTPWRPGQSGGAAGLLLPALTDGLLPAGDGKTSP